MAVIAQLLKDQSMAQAMSPTIRLANSPITFMAHLRESKFARERGVMFMIAALRERAQALSIDRRKKTAEHRHAPIVKCASEVIPAKKNAELNQRRKPIVKK
jgi:hypothetical protein